MSIWLWIGGVLILFSLGGILIGKFMKGVSQYYGEVDDDSG